MKQKSTWLLKLAVVLMAIPPLALTGLLWFEIGKTAYKEAANGATLGYIILGILLLITVSLIPYLAALSQSFKLLHYIDISKAFSELSVAALKKIKKSALVISGIYVLALPLVAMVAEWDDAPGLIIIGMLPIFAAVVISIFAAVLERLLKEAIEIKTENELTV